MKKLHEDSDRTDCISLGDLKYSTVQLGFKVKGEDKHCHTKVPRFLVNAFIFLHERKYLDTEGIFRKQGNSSKITGAATEYFKGGKIDSDMSIFDVCVLVKRFIKSIKGGLFGEKEEKIIDCAFDQNGKGTPITLCHFCHTLPEYNFGVLAYLVFQMTRIIRHANNNKMNAENLATIFVPIMFHSFDRGIAAGNRDIHGIKRHQEILKQTVMMIITHESALLSPRMMLRNNSINRQQFPQPISNPIKDQITPKATPKFAPMVNSATPKVSPMANTVKVTPKTTPRALPKRSMSVSASKKPVIVAAPPYSHAAAISRTRSINVGQANVRSRSRTKWIETFAQKIRSKRSSYSFTNVNADAKSVHN